MSNIQGKIWGHTQPLFNKNNVEIHRIETKKGGHCSKHKHIHKYNMFYVESGKLKVVAWKNDYDLIDETILTKDQHTTISPNEYHKFEALEDSIVYEIYWVSLLTNDIERLDCGGNG